MPLEVRQIGIRMAVGDAGGEPAAGQDSSSGLPNDPDEGDEYRALLIEQCVAAVLDELARRAER